jgi:O-antigen/teichoic acid export membrane protein
LASLKKLAGQTAWYGLSAILARLLNYLLTPYLTYTFSKSVYGEMTLMYSVIPFLNVIFTYGMETTFFRFMNKDVRGHTVYNTNSISLLFTTLLLTATFITWSVPVAAALRLSHSEFITWSACIVALDAVCTLPFAKLRNDDRPKKYAFIRLAGIATNVALVFFFYSVLPRYAHAHPGTFLASWWNPSLGCGYVIIANLVMSGLNLLMLSKEFLAIRIEFNARLWRQMMIYSIPVMVTNFGGMINETFDRVMLDRLAPGNINFQKVQVGIYGACYKLSLLITLFIQAFRMGAEPFFLHQARGEEEEAKRSYARVMKYFVITISAMFLFVILYIDFWKHFIMNPAMWVGISVVPILLLANMCLGIYYNLAIWYKLSPSPWQGLTITLVGAIITLTVNYIFIPKYSYMACAWATFLCYFSMMVLSYIWGQSVYPVPYQVKRIGGYLALMLLVTGVEYGIRRLTENIWIRFGTSTFFFFCYLQLILKVEKEDLKKLPYVGRFIKGS